ncbi:MAG: 30S ribosomal protein S16 [Cytophagales bacterium]|jgi:small subunit ribosomal protein S16|nr:30S ribosomal protein S16 [Cytophagales bacterium]
MVVLRLARRGRKGIAIFSIVATNKRAPRDGKFLEKLGTYNTTTTPSQVSLNFDRVLHWLSVGAQPSDTVRSILSGAGVLEKFYLQNGVRKNLFDQKEADKRFEEWKNGVHARKKSAFSFV